MFGISFIKLLVLVAVVAVIWFAFRRPQPAVRRAPSEPELQPGVPPDARVVQAEDLVRCPRCGTYVAPRNPVSCGRSECPY